MQPRCLHQFQQNSKATKKTILFLAVKPQARWQKNGPLFEENLKKAKEINENNPRIYYLIGVSKYFTPKAFGGGKKAAQSYFEKAGNLFAKETEDFIANTYWGKRTNYYFYGGSNKEEEGEK